MTAIKRANTKPGVFSANDDSGAQPYDLFGEKRQLSECLSKINLKHKDVLKAIEFDCMRLINDHECKLELSRFTAAEINDSVEKHSESSENPTSLIYLQATNDLGQQTILAINYTTLYVLTELFLGGQQSRLAKNSKTGEASESELRLLERLLFIHLNTLDSALSVENTWKTRVIDTPISNEMKITSCACLSVTDFQALWQIWLPKEMLMVQSSSHLTQIDHEQLLAKLTFAAEAIPTELNIVLAKTQISLAQLTQLKSGDLIPIELPEIVSAYAGNQVIAHGKIVDRAGKLVLQVTKEKPLNC